MLKWLFKSKPKKHPHLLLIENVPVDRYKNIYSSDYSIFVIYSYRKNIILYISLIKKLIYYLKLKEIIPRTIIHNEIEQTTIRDFFIDSNGRTLDPVASLNDFLTISKEFIELYITYECLLAKDLATEKNIMLMSIYYKNVVDILQELSNG